MYKSQIKAKSALLHLKDFDVVLEGDLGPFAATLTLETDGLGVQYVHLHLASPAAQIPPPLALTWAVPSVEMPGRWDTGTGWYRGQGVEWGGGLNSSATSQAPVVCFYTLAGQNRLTFAFSDALNPISLHAPIHEETVQVQCAVRMFQKPGPPVAEYHATLRIDTNAVPYYTALSDVQAWWAALPGMAPAPVPDAARVPLYSTWYSMHQQLTAESIEAQCREAKEIGCGGVIVDDGWQTEDSGRGYAYCGDWEVASARIPDMKAHVARVQAMGMKYLLWYSVPFVGVHSRVWPRFQDKFLEVTEINGQVGVLDPRFPDVREYLIGIYERALREWGVDGFKLDFVDSFHLPASSEDTQGGGRDFASVPQATDRLLADSMARLRAIKDDVCIEFRQSYIGPLMRKYGNMFRAGDCPADLLSNRLKTLDIRLLCGGTACHADMIEWHAQEPAEGAALHLINTLFAVPQVSVLLDTISTEHREILRWWIGFWREHRDVLLDGRLMPLHPEAMYPLVFAANGTTLVAAVYQNIVVVLDRDVPARVWIVNGTPGSGLVLDLAQAIGARQIVVRDCRGRVVRTEDISLGPGLHTLQIPPSGTACLSAHEM